MSIESNFFFFYQEEEKPVPPVQALWVEDQSGEQMITEDGAEEYEFVE